MQNHASNPTEKTHGQLAKGSAKDQISSRGIFHPKDVLWIKGWWAGTGPDRRSASALPSSGQDCRIPGRMSSHNVVEQASRSETQEMS